MSTSVLHERKYDDMPLLPGEDEAWCRKVLEHFRHVMQALPTDVRQDYDYACSIAPDVARFESHPLFFIRREDSDLQKAAVRLATYWTQRRRWFGDDRAFRPLLDLSGKGALCPEDVEVIRNGDFGILSPCTRDGKSIVFCDRIKREVCDLDNTVLELRRVFWYSLYSLVTNPASSYPNHHIGLVRAAPIPFSGSSIPTLGSVASTALPTRFGAVHMVYLAEDIQRTDGVFRNLLANFWRLILPLIVRAFGTYLSKFMIIHRVNSAAEVPAKLAQHGVTALPTIFGGTWTFEREHQEFLKRSCRCWDEKPKAKSGQPKELNDVAEVVHTQALLQSESQNASYMQAHNAVPVLTANQARKFMQWAENPYVAALRLTKYWEYRLQYFGDKRAFLDINQTSDGALERKDLAVLQSGCWMQLPCDKEGRTVIYCDGSRLQKSTNNSRNRCAFYIWSLIMENDLSVDKGFVVVYHVFDPTFDAAVQESLSVLFDAFPVRLFKFHVIGTPRTVVSSDDEGQPRSAIKETLPLLHSVARDRAVTHSSPCESDFGQLLCRHGLTLPGLPKSIGGGFGYADFVQWQEMRVRHEWGLFISPRVRTIAREQFRIKLKTAESAAVQDKNERKRRLDSIHSRRKRESRRIEMEQLVENKSELEQRNKKLQTEATRLENLLNQAQLQTRDASMR